jgi:hypothetical protein
MAEECLVAMGVRANKSLNHRHYREWLPSNFRALDVWPIQPVKSIYQQ